MKGLILKDLLNLRKYMKSLLTMVLLFVVMGVAMSVPSMVAGVGIMFCMMVSLLAFSYDESSKWDAYGLSLPVTRRQSVAAKYLLALALIAVGTALGAGLSLLTMALTGHIALDELVGTAVGTASAGLLTVGLLFPFIYKFGVEKSRFIMILLFLVPFGGTYAWIRLVGPIGPMAPGMLRATAVAAPILLLLLCVASYFISQRIYEKKEL